jgi:hypothetical protein
LTIYSDWGSSPAGDRGQPAPDQPIKTGTRFRLKATGAELFFITEAHSGKVLLIDPENDRLVTRRNVRDLG